MSNNQDDKSGELPSNDQLRLYQQLLANDRSNIPTPVIVRPQQAPTPMPGHIPLHSGTVSSSSTAYAQRRPVNYLVSQPVNPQEHLQNYPTFHQVSHIPTPRPVATTEIYSAARAASSNNFAQTDYILAPPFPQTRSLPVLDSQFAQPSHGPQYYYPPGPSSTLIAPSQIPSSTLIAPSQVHSSALIAPSQVPSSTLIAPSQIPSSTPVFFPPSFPTGGQPTVSSSNFFGSSNPIFQPNSFPPPAPFSLPAPPYLQQNFPTHIAPPTPSISSRGSYFPRPPPSTSAHPTPVQFHPSHAVTPGGSSIVPCPRSTPYPPVNRTVQNDTFASVSPCYVSGAPSTGAIASSTSGPPSSSLYFPQTPTSPVGPPFRSPQYIPGFQQHQPPVSTNACSQAQSLPSPAYTFAQSTSGLPSTKVHLSPSAVSTPSPSLRPFSLEGPPEAVRINESTPQQSGYSEEVIKSPGPVQTQPLDLRANPSPEQTAILRKVTGGNAGLCLYCSKQIGQVPIAERCVDTRFCRSRCLENSTRPTKKKATSCACCLAWFQLETTENEHITNEFKLCPRCQSRRNNKLSKMGSNGRSDDGRPPPPTAATATGSSNAPSMFGQRVRQYAPQQVVNGQMRLVGHNALMRQHSLSLQRIRAPTPALSANNYIAGRNAAQPPMRLAWNRERERVGYFHPPLASQCRPTMEVRSVDELQSVILGDTPIRFGRPQTLNPISESPEESSGATVLEQQQQPQRHGDSEKERTAAAACALVTLGNDISGTPGEIVENGSQPDSMQDSDWANIQQTANSQADSGLNRTTSSGPADCIQVEPAQTAAVMLASQRRALMNLGIVPELRLNPLYSDSGISTPSSTAQQHQQAFGPTINTFQQPAQFLPQSQNPRIQQNQFDYNQLPHQVQPQPSFSGQLSIDIPQNQDVVPHSGVPAIKRQRIDNGQAAPPRGPQFQRSQTPHPNFHPHIMPAAYLRPPVLQVPTSTNSGQQQQQRPPAQTLPVVVTESTCNTCTVVTQSPNLAEITNSILRSAMIGLGRKHGSPYYQSMNNGIQYPANNVGINQSQGDQLAKDHGQTSLQQTELLRAGSPIPVPQMLGLIGEEARGAQVTRVPRDQTQDLTNGHGNLNNIMPGSSTAAALSSAALPILGTVLPNATPILQGTQNGRGMRGGRVKRAYTRRTIAPKEGPPAIVTTGKRGRKPSTSRTPKGVRQLRKTEMEVANSLAAMATNQEPVIVRETNRQIVPPVPPTAPTPGPSQASTLAKSNLSSKCTTSVFEEMYRRIYPDANEPSYNRSCKMSIDDQPPPPSQAVGDMVIQYTTPIDAMNGSGVEDVAEHEGNEGQAEKQLLEIVVSSSVQEPPEEIATLSISTPRDTNPFDESSTRVNYVNLPYMLTPEQRGSLAEAAALMTIGREEIIETEENNQVADANDNPSYGGQEEGSAADEEDTN